FSLPIRDKGRAMPYNQGSDVYVVSVDDTGEIFAPKEEQIYDVKHDSDGSYRAHHELDLKPIPLNERVIFKSYYYIVKAWREGKIRKHTKRTFRLDGRRL